MSLLLPTLLAAAAGAAGCSLGGRWVVVSPDLYAMARVQFCVYAIVESSRESDGGAALELRKVDEAGGCWGGTPCCGWWDTASGSREGATLDLRFAAANGTRVRTSGLAQPGCSAFDLDSGQLFMRSSTSVWSMAPLAWLKTMTALTVRAARQTATDGTVLLSPGWPPHYGGQFARDAFYGVDSALDLLPNRSQARNSAEWVFSHQRAADGAMPQVVFTDGTPEYSQTCVHDGQPTDNGTVCVVGDSGPFAVKTAAVWTLSDTSTPAAARKAWFESVAPALIRGMDATPLRDDLVWSDPNHYIVGCERRDAFSIRVRFQSS